MLIQPRGGLHTSLGLPFSGGRAVQELRSGVRLLGSES